MFAAKSLMYYEREIITSRYSRIIELGVYILKGMPQFFATIVAFSTSLFIKTLLNYLIELNRLYYVISLERSGIPVNFHQCNLLVLK